MPHHVYELEEFLFGADRISLAPVTHHIRDLQRAEGDPSYVRDPDAALARDAGDEVLGSVAFDLADQT
jgi:hypothetical protein